MLAGAKRPISAQGRGLVVRNLRSKGPRAGVGFLGRGQGSQPPSHQLGGLEELRKFPQRGTGQKRGREKVFLHSRGASWPLLELDGGQVRGPPMASLPHLPLKSAYESSCLGPMPSRVDSPDETRSPVGPLVPVTNRMSR